MAPYAAILKEIIPASFSSASHSTAAITSNKKIEKRGSTSLDPRPYHLASVNAHPSWRLLGSLADSTTHTQKHQTLTNTSSKPKFTTARTARLACPSGG